MSRLDWITAIIVAICVAALGFLIYKTVGLMNTDDPTNKTETVITDTQDESALDTTTVGDESTAGIDTIDDDEGIRYTDGDKAAADDDELSGQKETEEIEDDSPSNYVEESSISGTYLVIAGSYQQKINAENQVRRLHRLGYDNARVALFDRGAFAVAFVDAFDSFSKADNLSTQLSEDGIEAYVQKKR